LWISVCLMLNCLVGGWVMRRYYMRRFCRELMHRGAV
jgi:hypothetical protein